MKHIAMQTTGDEKTYSLLLERGTAFSHTELARQLAELGKACDGQVLVVDLATLNLGEDERLCLLDNRQNPRTPLGILVRADTEVELLLGLVLVEVGCPNTTNIMATVRTCLQKQRRARANDIGISFHGPAHEDMESRNHGARSTHVQLPCSTDSEWGTKGDKRCTHPRILHSPVSLKMALGGATSTPDRNDGIIAAMAHLESVLGRRKKRWILLRAGRQYTLSADGGHYGHSQCATFVVVRHSANHTQLVAEGVINDGTQLLQTASSEQHWPALERQRPRHTAGVDGKGRKTRSSREYQPFQPVEGASKECHEYDKRKHKSVTGSSKTRDERDKDD